MPELTLGLSDAQFQALCSAAAISGKTVTQLAEEAVSTAVEVRYVLPKSSGAVLPFQGLKSSRSGEGE